MTEFGELTGLGSACQLNAARLVKIDGLPNDSATPLAEITAVRGLAIDEITAARGLAIDEITAARGLLIDGLPADTATPLLELTVARGLLIDGLPADSATPLSELTVARGLLIDGLPADSATPLGLITAARATILDNQAGGTTSGTYSLPNDVADNTAITIALATRRKIHNIYLDLVNLVQNCTIRIKNEIDGATARTLDTVAWTTADDDGIIIAGFVTDTDTTVTIQSAVAQGAAKDIPYRVIWEQMQ